MGIVVAVPCDASGLHLSGSARCQASHLQGQGMAGTLIRPARALHAVLVAGGSRGQSRKCWLCVHAPSIHGSRYRRSFTVVLYSCSRVQRCLCSAIQHAERFSEPSMLTLPQRSWQQLHAPCPRLPSAAGLPPAWPHAPQPTWAGPAQQHLLST